MPARVRRGFTLIELMIVVVVIGLLAAIAAPHFKTSKGKAYAGSMKSDLHNLSTAEEMYFTGHATYTTVLDSLSVRPSPGVQLTIVEATKEGWSATSQHPMAYPLKCGIFYGSAAAPLSSATAEGVIGCQ